MDLKNLITDEELHELKGIAEDLPHFRNALSKVWRMCDVLIKKVDVLVKKEEMNGNNTKSH